MCAASSLWARLDRVVFCANRDDAADGGFDDRAFYELLTTAPQGWPTVGPGAAPGLGRLALPGLAGQPGARRLLSGPRNGRSGVQREFL